MKSGEIVEAREWPHPPFHPLNYSAAKVLDFFNTRMKSRLYRSLGAAIAFASTAGIAPIAHDRCC